MIRERTAMGFERDGNDPTRMTMRLFILIALAILVAWFAADSARADGSQDGNLRLPPNPVAGQPMSVGAGHEGGGTLYLIGPGQVIRREVKEGGEVQIKGEELRSAGRWVAILKSGGSSSSKVFWVKEGTPESLSFLAHPSRVPVARQGVINGFVFVFDRFHNLILQPTPVNFSLSVGGAGATHIVASRDGLASIDASSAAKEGAAQFVASVGNVSVRRVVQQVASEPCNLRMHVAQRTKDAVIIETDPVRDCSGNAVPDGTIVTFMQTDATGKSMVDARIKKGIAQAQLPLSSDATISVASGVVLGNNELRIGGGR